MECLLYTRLSSRHREITSEQDREAASSQKAHVLIEETGKQQLSD